MTGPVTNSPTITVSYYQIEGTGLEDRAKFASDADRQIFLDAIKNAREQDQQGHLNPTLQIPQPVNAEELGLVSSKLTQAYDVTGDAIADVMTMLHELGVEQRKVAKETRKVEQDAQVTAIQDQASKIREAAGWALAAGLTSGLTTMASGAMSLAGTFKAGAKTMETQEILSNPEGKIKAQGWVDGKFTKVGELSPTQQTRIQSLNSQADVIRTKWQAGGQLLQGAGDMVKSGFEFQAKQKEAEQKELEAEATKHQFAAQSADEAVQNARDLVNDVRGKWSELQQGRSQVESKIWS